MWLRLLALAFSAAAGRRLHVAPPGVALPQRLQGAVALQDGAFGPSAGRASPAETAQRSALAPPVPLPCVGAEAEAKLRLVLSGVSTDERSSGKTALNGEPSVDAMLDQLEVDAPPAASFDRGVLVGTWLMEYGSEIPRGVRSELTQHTLGIITDLRLTWSINPDGTTATRAVVYQASGEMKVVSWRGIMAQIGSTPRFTAIGQGFRDIFVSSLKNGIIILHEYLAESSQMAFSGLLTDNEKSDRRFERTVWRRVEEPQPFPGLDAARMSRHGGLWRFGLSKPAAEAPLAGLPPAGGVRGRSLVMRKSSFSEGEIYRRKRENRNRPIIATVLGAIFLATIWEEEGTLQAAFQDVANDGDLLGAANLLMSLPGDLVKAYYEAASSTDETVVVLSKAATSLASYTLGDVLAQVFEGVSDVELLDLARTGRNGALGFFLHGPILHYWIRFLDGPFSERVGSEDLATTLLFKVILDQTLFAASLNLAYATLDNIFAGSNVSAAFGRARSVLLSTLVASWRFWPFVNALTYSPLIPEAFKLLWIDTAEILWVAILSTTVNANITAEATGAASIAVASTTAAVPPAEPVKTMPVGFLWDSPKLRLLKSQVDTLTEWISQLPQGKLDRLVQRAEAFKTGGFTLAGQTSSRWDLRNYCFTLCYILSASRLRDRVRDEDRDLVGNAVRETLAWIDTNRFADSATFEAKAGELREKVKTVLATVLEPA